MIGIIGFGVPYVSGRKRVPSPPTRTIACSAYLLSVVARPLYPEVHALPLATLSAHARPMCKTVGTRSCEHMFDMAKCKYDWPMILKFHLEGHSLTECRRRFGYATDAWYKAIARGAIVAPPRQNTGGTKRYDWTEVQRYYDEGHSYYECRKRFGFCSAAWFKARARGEIKSRPLGRPLDELLARGKSRYNIKLRLLRAGILTNRCEECGLSEWRGKPLSIQIDHVNGIRNDHRLENLRMLCPNCHSQTETFASRNKGKYSLFPGRLTVGRGPLESVIVVRIPAREPWPHLLEA